MDKKIKLTIATAFLTAIQASTASAHMEPKEGDGMEKCYGVVKAGQNDCASKANSHSCAGQAKVDADPNEWIKIPNGLCNKLGNSTLKPKEEG